ncbi:hypothetical protein [Acidipila sp. EB88]|uniref:hypothetical protein n=1 Tax=Acidipila sp. EB88 TaxID=2305226 RepID=UPI00351983BB
MQRVTSYGVEYTSYTEQYLDSTRLFKDAMIGILAAVAKQERVRMSERTRGGLSGRGWEAVWVVVRRCLKMMP